MIILLIGSGGREHALAYKMLQSSKCSTLFVAPGNAGTGEIGRASCRERVLASV